MTTFWAFLFGLFVGAALATVIISLVVIGKDAMHCPHCEELENIHRWEIVRFFQGKMEDKGVTIDTLICSIDLATDVCRDLQAANPKFLYIPRRVA